MSHTRLWTLGVAVGWLVVSGITWSITYDPACTILCFENSFVFILLAVGIVAAPTWLAGMGAMALAARSRVRAPVWFLLLVLVIALAVALAWVAEALG